MSQEQSSRGKTAGKGRGRRRRGRGGGKGKGGAHAAGAHTAPSHSSHPTTRSAQVATRAFLLKKYGPVCAYCGGRFDARRMTLDHVAPRRGQNAYDRRDNLVLACAPCNALKRDQAPLAFLLGRRSRAVNLVKHGAHLSEELLRMARDLIPGHVTHATSHNDAPRHKWGPAHPDEKSPYKD